MSGGHYTVRPYQVTELGADILQDVEKFSTSGESGDYYSKQQWEALPADILEIMRLTGNGLERLGKLAHCVDYLMSNDYGPETFRAVYEKWSAEGGLVIGLPTAVCAAAHDKAEELAELRSHSQMLSQIAAYVMPYLPENSEMTTLQGVQAMQAEIERLQQALADARRQSTKP